MFLIFVASVALPILLIALYSKWVSPVHHYDSLRDLPTGYKIWLGICIAVPVIGAATLNYIERFINMDALWPAIFGITILMCTIAVDAILLPARRNKWLTLLILPHFIIAAVSAAVVIFMTLYALDNHPKMF